MTVGVVVIHDTTPFRLSLSKSFDKLSLNGSKLAVMICGSLNNLQLRGKGVA